MPRGRVDFRRGYLREAVTHSSYANEHKNLRSNERLEFLGDTVLGLVVSEELFLRYPDLPEGELTRRRSTLVCEAALAKMAHGVDLGRHLLLGKSEEISGGRERDSLLADAFEAVLGGLYLDHGLEDARDFLLEQLAPFLTAMDRGDGVEDYKTLLQETVQRRSGRLAYHVEKESGPEHRKVFAVAVKFNGKVMGRGSGHSKKEAEQAAARQALKRIK
ncbi:MAG: ribonuclease III [Thermaerobacter sp.]|nr:ribonuclease III [Thermaerobacter sp.]MDA8145850.1 ribonuclease III [Thermaerobacter sp.]